MSNPAIDSLKEALSVSPDNIPLRLHLAELLFTEKMFAEAEVEFTAVLQRSKDNMKAKKGLARACYEQKKFSMAAVILEEICKLNETEAAYHILFSRVLLTEGAHQQASEQYRKALQKDERLFDDELDELFRVPTAGAQFDDEDEDDDGEDYFGSRENRQDDRLIDQLMLEKPDMNFSDVGGMDKVKDEIRIKIIMPMQHPELYKAYGKKAGGGILLYGPPGCGKTHIARATAGEVNANFINVGLSHILDMWLGNSEKNLHKVFEYARANTPCVLFFDEVDALGANRTDMKHSASRLVINQFLSELDGVEASNEGVLILAATNAPWHLDPAFRRPGRFDRIVFVPPPDEISREEILKVMLRAKPTENIQLGDVVKKSKEFSGADLRSVIELVIEEKLRSSFKTGIPEPIRTKDLLQMVAKVNPSTKDWFTIARNYALYSNESGQYDEILSYLNIKKQS